MKVGIVLDKWKLKIFKKNLDKHGYVYEQSKGPHRTIMLSVETDDIDKLTPIIKQMNDEAARLKRH